MKGIACGPTTASSHLAGPRRLLGPLRVPLVLGFVVLVLYWRLWNIGAQHGHGKGQAAATAADEGLDEAAWKEKERLWKTQFAQEEKALKGAPAKGSIYGNTLETVVDVHTPYTFDPYPRYNSQAWNASHAEYVPCRGPAGGPIDDIRVFKGRPASFPAPGLGSFDVLGLDEKVCYERETRLGPYGYGENMSSPWHEVDWGSLQQECLRRNRARFDATMSADEARTPEPRTAVFLRSSTDRKYTENDVYVMRSMIGELALRTGGQYHVFLLVEAKAKFAAVAAATDGPTAEQLDQMGVPKEFWNMTLLWSEEQMRKAYPMLKSSKQTMVHNAQWLALQQFVQKKRDFDYVVNWEMDTRTMGHHYDTLEKMVDFAKRQPRRGLWERNERFYIAAVHGDYDTDFRRAVAAESGEKAWGPAASVPHVHAVGPRPPTPTPDGDDYSWGVGEEADLITLSPMFDPVDSNWILRDQVWGYEAGTDLPRRAAIVTQCRLSRRLLDAMHAENARGRQVGSEMAPATTALLHGLKAVFVPHPVLFDAAWPPDALQRWFNAGPGARAGGRGSAMGWGREQRFRGSTWYYRAEPPQRLYNHWFGYEDGGLGGPEWELRNGRPCLPAVVLHPVKTVEPTEPGFASDSRLPYD